MRELDLLRSAVSAFEQRLKLVEAAHWRDPTPCGQWNVRELVEHVVAGNRLAVALLKRGGRVALAEAEGADDATARAFRRSAADQARAFADAAPSREVEHPAGRLTNRSFAVYRSADIAVHTWDLARATGADAQLDDELIDQAVVPYVAWVATLDVEGMFGGGPSGRVPPDASRQDRLLDELGRRPR